MTNASRIAELFRGVRFSYANEDQLHAGMAQFMEQSGIEFEAEVRLTVHDRIDFMVGSVGIEVKVGHPLSQVIRQLHRYAQLPQITDLILVTNRCAHAAVPPTINGKPVEFVFLGWGMLA